MAINMTYQKPKDVSFTDMAMYIDDHIKEFVLNEDKEPLEIQKIYSYLYFLIYMLACKERCFNNIQEYDDFALVAAGKCYVRLTDPRQFMDPPQIKPIESILNYLKFSLRGMRVDYQADNYTQIFDPRHDDVSLIDDALRSNVRSDYHDGLQEAIIDEAKKIPGIIIKILKETPYRRDKVMIKNLFQSVLLTFISSITLPVGVEAKIIGKQDLTKDNEKKLIEAIRMQKEEPAVLYHLDPSMGDYVKLLVNKVKKEFGAGVMDTRQEYELDDATVDNIIAANFDRYDNQGDDENDNR